MRDREIKKLLKNAYELSETEKEKAFVRKYGKRSLRLADMIRLELRYMGTKSIPAGAVLTALLLAAVKTGDRELVRTFTSFVPMCALIPVTLLSGSERSGMDELEAASRFSLRLIRIVRMFILGIFSMLLLLAVGIILHAGSVFSAAEQLELVVFPYFASTCGSMLVARKWHGKENIIGILSVCASSGLFPLVIRPEELPGQLPYGWYILILAVLLGAMIRECMLYVKESEDISWNYC